MWFRVFLLVLALASSSATAQQFSIGVQTALILNFAQPSSFTGVLTAEARGLTSGVGVRGSAGFSDALELALDGVYHFDGSDYGNLYLGLGLGLSRSVEFRALVGFEWEVVSSTLSVCAEGVLRVLTSSDPRLSFTLGLVYFI